MNEHLFKLKKDGKTVGYMKFEGAKPLYRKHQFSEWHSNNNFTPIVLFKLKEMSIHPFVTKDKNGDDVFADDKIKALYFWPDARKPQTITGKIGWREETLNWVLYHTPNTPEGVDLWQLHDIELIEEEK